MGETSSSSSPPFPYPVICDPSGPSKGLSDHDPGGALIAHDGPGSTHASHAGPVYRCSIKEPTPLHLNYLISHSGLQNTREEEPKLKKRNALPVPYIRVIRFSYMFGLSASPFSLRSLLRPDQRDILQKLVVMAQVPATTGDCAPSSMSDDCSFARLNLPTLRSHYKYRPGWQPTETQSYRSGTHLAPNLEIVLSMTM